MLIDLRHHIITLIAVFLALAVGILVGSSFITGSSVERRVGMRLEREFDKIRLENRAKQQVIENQQERMQKQAEFDRAAAPFLVQGRLQWRHVAIIQTGDYSEATKAAESILEAAGAKVVSVTMFTNLDSPSAHERASNVIISLKGDAGQGDPISTMLRIVANSIATGSNPEALTAFQQSGLLTMSGEYYKRVPTVVLIGGDRQEKSVRARHVDLTLIDKLKEAGVMTLVGAEPVDAATSYIPAYHLKAIPTVDNVDQPMGQVALVFAVIGETGNFGVKKSADRVSPAYLESGQWRDKYRY